MPHDSPLAIAYPAVSRKKVTAAFDGGRLSSDSGVMLLGIAERRRGLAKTIAALRDPAHVTHTFEDILKSRMLTIACGYADGNDFDWLRSDPAFKPCSREACPREGGGRGSPAGGCRIRAPIYARSRPSRVGRTRRR